MNSYLNFEQGEISIYLAGNALTNLQLSLGQAEAIRRDKRHGAVLYINTSFTTRRFLSAWREHISSTEGIYSLDCPLGELLGEFDEIMKMVEKHNIRQIIINNWEYGFKDSRRKEQAIFGLQEFLNKGVSVLVYAQSNPEKTFAGKIMHGGLGKLSGLSISINDLTKRQKTEEKQDAIISEDVNLVANEINDLDTLQPHIWLEDIKEPIGSVFSVTESGIISQKMVSKHLPMSNKNRKLLAEYEKLHGKSVLPGESYRQMFDRVVGIMIAEEELVEA